MDRIIALERRVGELERDHAVAQNDRSHLDRRFDKLEGKLDWMGKILIGAILAAIAKFIIDGGLSGGLPGG